jgi:hypothetical protein
VVKPSKPKAPAAPVRPSTAPQRDATGAAAVGQRSPDRGAAGMKLPHERDESAEQDTSIEHGGTGRPVIEQGASDLESGQRDTDCYNANAPRYRRHERRGG